MRWTAARRGLLAVVLLLLLPVLVRTAHAASSAAVPLNPCVNPDNGAPGLAGLSLTSGPLDVRHRATFLEAVSRPSTPGGPGPATGLRNGHVWLEL